MNDLALPDSYCPNIHPSSTLTCTNLCWYRPRAMCCLNFGFAIRHQVCILKLFLGPSNKRNLYWSSADFSSGNLFSSCLSFTGSGLFRIEFSIVIPSRFSIPTAFWRRSGLSGERSTVDPDRRIHVQQISRNTSRACTFLATLKFLHFHLSFLGVVKNNQIHLCGPSCWPAWQLKFLRTRCR